MKSSTRRIVIGAAFFGLTFVGAVCGYMAAGWHVLDAIYMVVITVFGVGYGEAKPLDSPGLKVFTMGVIIAGCSSAIYVVGGFVQMLAEGEINRVLGNRRMSKGIDQLSNHALICGYGRVGQMLANDLLASKFPFVIIDSNESRIADAQAAGCLTVRGSASEDQTMRDAGIDRASVVAAVLPDDTANVFVTLTARELNPTVQIIARAEAKSTEKKLIRSGANRVVLPALIGATKIGHMIMRPSAEDLLLEATGTAHLNEELHQIGLELLELEIQPNSPLVGQTVGEIELGNTGGCVFVAIKRPDRTIVQSPGPREVLNARDVFVILGHAAALPELTRRAKARPQTMYRGAAV